MPLHPVIPNPKVKTEDDPSSVERPRRPKRTGDAVEKRRAVEKGAEDDPSLEQEELPRRPRKTRAYVDGRRRKMALEAIEVVRRLKEAVRENINKTRLERSCC